MPDAKIPQNQQEALPLLSVTDATQPDTVTLTGGGLTKFWSPSATGIFQTSRIADTLDPPPPLQGAAWFSNFLDVRGCSKFQIVLVIEAAAVGDDCAPTMAIAAQYRSGGVSPRSGGGAGLGTALFSFLPSLFVPGALIGSVGGYPAEAVAAINLSEANGTAPPSGMWIGTDMRIWIRTSDVLSIPPGYLLSMSLWGTGP